MNITREPEQRYDYRYGLDYADDSPKQLVSGRQYPFSKRKVCGRGHQWDTEKKCEGEESSSEKEYGDEDPCRDK